MSKIEELKTAFEASTLKDWEVLTTTGLPHVVCLTENEVDVMTIAGCGTDADAQFIALAHNMMPQLLDAVELVKKFVADHDYAIHVNGFPAGDGFTIRDARAFLEELK